MIYEYLLHIVSDTILVVASILYICNFEIAFIKDKKHFVLSMFAVALLSICTFFMYLCNLYSLILLMYPLMFISAYLIAFKQINISQIYIAIISELITSLLSSCFSSIIFKLIPLPQNITDLFSLLFVRIAFFICAVICKNKKSVKYIHKISKTIPKHIFTLVLVSATIILMLATFNKHPNNNAIKQTIVTILIAILTITLIIMIFSLLINVASKNYYTALNSLLEKQVETQISHYEKLEELNSDIRRLRHDYINHLTSIGTLIENEDYSDAQQYVERLTEATHCHETFYNTGNHLADAILTGKSNECKDFADIEFNGIITDKINNTDMCAILANALDNAIEACRKCSGRSKISIASQNKQGYWVMTMRNPTISEDSDGLMKTSKKDTQNHGFGLLSIEQAVKRYDGNIKVGIKDGIFEISIVVKV